MNEYASQLAKLRWKNKTPEEKKAIMANVRPKLTQEEMNEKMLKMRAARKSKQDESDRHINIR